MKRIIICICFQIALLPNTHADSSRKVTVLGVGNESCGTFLSVLPNSNEYEAIKYEGKDYSPDSIMKSHMYSEWLHAYVTAFNWYNNQRENIRIPDEDGMRLWVKNWCEDHPLETVFEAAHALIVDQIGYIPKPNK